MHAGIDMVLGEAAVIVVLKHHLALDYVLIEEEAERFHLQKMPNKDRMTGHIVLVVFLRLCVLLRESLTW